MLTPTQISHVQGSFAQVAPIADAAAEMFYRRLFELDPTLSRLFKGDMKQQGQKLMQMIGAAVRGLDDLARLVPVVQQLGVRHNSYGVRPEHYDKVGAALLWTLEKGLGPAYPPEVRQAWTAVYGLLANTMRAAASSRAPPRSRRRSRNRCRSRLDVALITGVGHRSTDPQFNSFNGLVLISSQVRQPGAM